jgi:hypothetical protein
MESAREQAHAIGATHIVWTNVRCVVFVGEKASARIFDCGTEVALDDVFENYLTRDNDLSAVTAPSDGPAKVMMSSDLDADTEDMTLRGYALVGYAAASGSAIRLDAIRERSNSLGAEKVLVHTRSTGVDVEYQAVTTYSRGGVGVGFTNAWGSGTYGSWTASAKTRIAQPGISQTEFVPFSQRRFQTQALFWRKRLPGPFGMFTAKIPLTLRASLQRNTGAFVFAIEDDSPAFFANILPGDLVIGVDGEEIRAPSELATAASQKASATIVFQLLRGGEVLNVSVAPQQPRQWQ